MSIITRIIERPIFRYGMLVYIVSVVFSAVFFYTQQQTELSFSLGDRLENRVDKELSNISKELEESIRSVRTDLDGIKGFINADVKQYKELVTMLQSTDVSNLEKALSASKKLDQYSERIKKVERQIENVKKSLNPTDSQLLSVVRLADKFELILNKISTVESKLQTFEKETQEKLERNYDLAAAQVDRIIDMLKWVGLLLIPIIFTTIRELFNPRKPEAE